MTRIRVCTGTLVALATAVVIAEPDFIPPEPLHEAGLVKYWQLRLPLDPGQYVRDAFLVDDQIYLGTQDGYAFAVDAPTGVIRWLQPIARSGYHFFRPCHTSEWTIFVTPVDIQVYERLTGEPVDRKRLRFAPGTGAITDGVRLFIGGIDHRLWTYELFNLFVDWRVLGDGPIVSTPVLHNGFILAANDGGTVYSMTAADKRFRWRAITYGPITADLVLDARKESVFVASGDQSLYMIDLTYGRVRWRTRFGSPLRDAPFVTPELAFQFSDQDGVVAVDATPISGVENRQRWSVPDAQRVLTVSADYVYVLSRGGDILAVRTADGQIEHVVPAQDLGLPMPVQTVSAVLLASTDGRIFCARPLGVAPLQREDILNAFRAAAPQQEEVAEAGPAAQPQVQQAPDMLRSRLTGPPLGGKSKVSRGFGSGAEE